MFNSEGAQSLHDFFASFQPRPRSWVNEQDAKLAYSKDRVLERRRLSSTNTSDAPDDIVSFLSEAFSKMSSPGFKEEWQSYNVALAEEAVLKVKEKAEELVLRHGVAHARAEQMAPDLTKRSTDLYYRELTDNLKWYPIEPHVMYAIAQAMTNDRVHQEAWTVRPNDEPAPKRKGVGRSRHRSIFRLPSFLQFSSRENDPLSMREVISAVRALETLIAPFDRDDLIHKCLIEPMKRDIETEKRLLSFAEDLIKINKQLRVLDDRVRDVPELVDFRTGQPFNFRRKDLIAIALNVGNYGENSNFQVLVDGYKWRADDVIAALDRTLSEAEWRFVSEVYKVYACLFEESQEVYHRVSGVEFELRKTHEREFIPRSFNSTVGGYYPQLLDLSRSISVSNGDRKLLSIERYYFGALPLWQIDSDFKGEKIIRINFDSILTTFAKQVHHLAFCETLIQAMKIIPDKRLKAVISEKYGAGYYDDVLRSLNKVRIGRNVDGVAFDRDNNYQRDLR